MGSTPTLGTINSLEVFTISTNLALLTSQPKTADEAKMVTLLTSLSLELDHIASRLCESVHRIFQGFGCASSIGALPTSNLVTIESQKVSHVSMW